MATRGAMLACLGKTDLATIPRPIERATVAYWRI